VAYDLLHPGVARDSPRTPRPSSRRGSEWRRRMVGNLDLLRVALPGETGSDRETSGVGTRRAQKSAGGGSAGTRLYDHKRQRRTFYPHSVFSGQSRGHSYPYRRRRSVAYFYPRSFRLFTRSGWQVTETTFASPPRADTVPGVTIATSDNNIPRSALSLQDLLTEHHIEARIVPEVRLVPPSFPPTPPSEVFTILVWCG